MYADLSQDCQDMAQLLADIDVLDIVSFGSSISPEYLLSLISNADVGNKKFGFVGTSLPGNGWSAGLNDVVLAGKADWIIGGFFATVRQVGAKISTNSISAVNFPQGILAKLLTLPTRQIETHIGLGTFLDPRDKAGVLHLCTRQHQNLADLASLSDNNRISYRLPQSQAVLLRASGQTTNGSIVPEMEPIDLDIPRVVAAARANGTRLIIQVPPGPPVPEQSTAIPLQDGDRVFVAPRELHTTCFFPNRYLLDENAIHGRTGALVNDLVKRITPRLSPKESLIVGIGYPVAIAQAVRTKGGYQINVESGNINGVPLDGPGFGFNIAPEKRISQLDMFERIWSADIQHAILGLGEIDKRGAINIAKLGPNYNGVGGFVDISQSLKKVTFCSPEKPINGTNVDWNCFNSNPDQDIEWIKAPVGVPYPQ